MKRILSVLLLLMLMLAMTGCGQAPAPPDDDTDPTPPENTGDLLNGDGSLVSSFNTFAFNSAPLVVDTSKNVCYSPFSYYIALSMATQGASGETRTQLDQLLGILPDGYTLNDLAMLLTSLSGDTDGNVLHVSNSAWIGDQYTVNEVYHEDLINFYDAGMFTVDFSDADTADEITQWISEQTEGKLSPSFQLDEDTALMLVNALYLNNRWQDDFSEAATQPEDFTLADGSVVQHDFMVQQTTTGYADTEGYTLVSKTLAGGGSMVFVLPDEGSSPADLMADPAKLSAIYNTAEEDTLIRLLLPKFTFEDSFDLTKTLEALNAGRAATDDAEFTGMLETPQPLTISAILQQTYVGIDEKGVEAAAATEVVMNATAAPVDPTEPIEVVFDRPFLFFITKPAPDGQGDVILFVGVVNDPTK